jgi:hypothetical protein
VWCSHVRTRILIRNFDIRIDFVLKVMQLMVRAIIEELHAMVNYCTCPCGRQCTP